MQTTLPSKLVSGMTKSIQLYFLIKRHNTLKWIGFNLYRSDHSLLGIELDDIDASHRSDYRKILTHVSMLSADHFTLIVQYGYWFSINIFTT